MKVPSVSQSTWKRLYTLTQKFSALEPWEWMEDADLFGVENPKTGEMGYCCVLGAAEQVFGLTVYRGSSGLRTYQRMLSGELSVGDDELLLAQNCLQAELVDRTELEAEDRKVLKKLGWKLNKSAEFSQFRSYIRGSGSALFPQMRFDC